MPIWTDALCTNQADDDEKSAQVDQMGRIYRRAACVYIFLQGDLPSAAPGSGLGGPFGGGFGGGFGGSPIGSSNGSDSGQAELGIRYAKRLARLIAPVSAEINSLVKGRPEAEWLPLQRERMKAFVRSLLAAQPQADMFRGFGGGSSNSEWFIDFAALKALFRQVSWWRRVWVVQESVLARERVVLLGKERCEWEDLRLAQKALMWMSVTQEEVVSDYGAIGGANSVYHHVNVIGSTTTHFWSLEGMFRKSVDEAKRGISQGEVPEDSIGGIPLLDVLLSTTSGGEKSVEASKPPDRIYGLRGLVEERDKIPVSYPNMTLPKILFIVGKLLLEKYGPVIMAYCRPTDYSPELPSWAPDMVSTMGPLIGERTEPGREVYHASRDTQWVPTEFPAAVYNNRTITLRGVFIGTVAEIGSAFRTWPEDPQYFVKCRSWFNELTRMIQQHGAADPQLLADCLANLWRVPIADRGLLTREKREDAFRRGFEVLTSTATGAAFTPPAWLASESFMYRRAWLVYPRRAFVDNAGRPGLGPKEAQAGDQLVIFTGAPAPFVVRGRSDGRFTMLGSVYVYGRMDGEAFPGEPSLVDIQLY
jgi:Heterokaryon incompatibility protein (HET)